MFFRLFLVLKVLVVSVYFMSFVAWPTPAIAAIPKILIYGDSLSAAYGIPLQQGWAVLLQSKLAHENLHYDIINASVSGETTSGGLSRFAPTLKQTRPDIVILELGANDGLRGLPVNDMRTNLETMILQSKKSGAKVLLVGMRIPPNYGAKYTETFSESYLQLSRKHKVSLVPFMLENVAVRPDLIQQDGLHPNAAGQPIILENIWIKLRPLLKRSRLHSTH